MEYGFGGMFPMGGGGMRNQIARVFDEHYHVYSFAMKEKSHLEDGDKIFLPPSALDALARMQVEYPMLFELKNPMTGKHTHCGVLEFSAEEGRCYIPFWMMEGLFLEEGALIAVKNVALSKVIIITLHFQYLHLYTILYRQHM
jgi:ubiquitin fusion degradation protein 1